MKQRSVLKDIFVVYKEILDKLIEQRKLISSPNIKIKKYTMTYKNIPNADTEEEGILDIMDLIHGAYMGVTNSVYSVLSDIKKSKTSPIYLLNGSTLLNNDYNMLASKVRMWKSSKKQNIQVDEKENYHVVDQVIQLYDMKIDTLKDGYKAYKKEGSALLAYEKNIETKLENANDVLHELIFRKDENSSVEELEKTYEKASTILKNKFDDANNNVYTILELLLDELNIYKNNIDNHLF